MTGEQEPPDDVRMKLEQNALLLGFESWNKDEKGYDEWEREFLRHCMRTQDKHPATDRGYFEAMGFQGPAIDAVAADSPAPEPEPTFVKTVTEPVEPAAAPAATPAFAAAPAPAPAKKSKHLSGQELRAKRKFRGLMTGIVLFIVMLVLGLVIFFTIVKAPTDNAVARGVAAPDGSFVDLEKGTYDVWAPEWMSGKPDVYIESEDGRQVFRTESGGIDTNVQGYTKLGSFEVPGGTYVIYADYTEVVISKPTGLLCGMCITFIVIMLVSALYAFVMLLGYMRAKRPPVPQAQYPPPGYPPQQRPPPGYYPPQQPPPGQYPPQQPPPGQYPQQRQRPNLLPPGKPSNFSAKKAEDSITLRWEPSLDQGTLPVSKFKVFRGLEPKGMLAIAEVPAESHEYEDRTVEVGTTYYYRVAAVSSAGEGRRTPPLKATIRAPPGGPATANGPG